MLRSRFFTSILVACIVGGMACKTSVKLPLCPQLARDNPSPIEDVGKRIAEVCERRKIKITVLSSTTAEFRGPSKQLKWLKKNFHFILCDFNQSAVALDQQTYFRCMSNAKKWIKIVQGDNPELLMIDGTEYCPVCCEAGQAGNECKRENLSPNDVTEGEQ